jgi:ribosomal protein S27E
MASQYGVTREYSNTDESESPELVQCPKCNVKTVPKGIAGKQATEKHCMNCGHVIGRTNH